MKLLPFAQSQSGSIGTELELQLIDPNSYDLTSKAKDLIRVVSQSALTARITPEITQSMIEINSSIHTDPTELYDELCNINAFLTEQGDHLGVLLAGGGTHPFQKWSLRKIFPSHRYRKKLHLFRYLAKRATVFGQHIHIGCKSGDEAIYLTHVLSRYVPHLIALSASSPYFEGIDTGFYSSRLNHFNAFPTCGLIPYVLTWEDFSEYYYKIKKLGIISSMKDVYWDIRPKPEFGTVEIRVCDTPLTIRRAVLNIAYLQGIVKYLIDNRPIEPTQNLYYLYNYNRFEACRFGYEGRFINPYTLKSCLLKEDILETINKINSNEYIEAVKKLVLSDNIDSNKIRNIYKSTNSFEKVVDEACSMWRYDNNGR